MKRRTFIRRMLGSIGAAVVGSDAMAAANLESRGILVQESALAGFQYYRGQAIWQFLREGERLTLVRELMNPHDSRAVAVYFKNDKLGYIPGNENWIAAQMLDRGERLEARITRLMKDDNPWRRVRFEVTAC